MMMASMMMATAIMEIIATSIMASLFTFIFDDFIRLMACSEFKGKIMRAEPLFQLSLAKGQSCLVNGPECPDGPLFMEPMPGLFNIHGPALPGSSGPPPVCF